MVVITVRQENMIVKNILLQHYTQKQIKYGRNRNKFMTRSSGQYLDSNDYIKTTENFPLFLSDYYFLTKTIAFGNNLPGPITYEPLTYIAVVPPPSRLIAFFIPIF